jgi:large repetitive protein
VVPDWGALRFDLFTGIVPGTAASRLNVVIEEQGNAGNFKAQFINLEKAKGTATEYADDRWRIGYGETGFETFSIDVPDSLRGKVATLKFELSSGSEVYLDNVFFKSQHLLLGNPTDARKPDGAGSYINNYLLEKSQYAVSYSGNKSDNFGQNTPNWVGWQLNNSWFISGEERPEVSFGQDPQLPSSLFYLVKHNDYSQTKTLLPDDLYLRRGHLAASADRSRTEKDSIATFLTTIAFSSFMRYNSLLYN